jgi:hypothetical protein
MSTYAKILTDHVSPDGHRLTIMEAELHRFVLAELNTHRSHSRSSASSRAIPVEKQLSRVIDEPAWPLVWASEQPGMQGGSELEGKDLADARWMFEAIHDNTVWEIESYLAKHPDKSTRLHKSLINRLLEPFMWHKVIFGATEDGWNNFFAQRASKFSPLAQPEMRAAADAMLEQYEASTPVSIEFGEWVTPYVSADEDFSEFYYAGEVRKHVSVARCARVSYLNHDGVRDFDADTSLFKSLVSADPMHAAPLEFVATPAREGETVLGNFTGFHQFRHLYLAEREEANQ